MRFLSLVTLLTLCIFYQSFAQPSDAVSFWVFDNKYHAETQQDDLTDDLSGNSNHLTADGFSVDFVDEIVIGEGDLYPGGNSIQFNGTSESFFINAASATDFNPGLSDFTIVAWLETDDVSGTKFILNKRQVGLGAGWYLRMSSVNMQAGLINLTSDIRASLSGLTANTKYFVVAEFDRDGNVSVEINDNGTLATNDISGSSGFSLTNSENLTIGEVSAVPGGSFYDGRLSGVLYIERLLTDQEKTDLYNLELQPLSVLDGDYKKYGRFSGFSKF